MEDLSRENLQRQFDTNFFGLVELTRQVLPVLQSPDPPIQVTVDSRVRSSRGSRYNRSRR